jgi:hypothetical protein
MPVYKTQTSYTTSLLPGDSFTSFNAEQPTPGNGGASAGERASLSIQKAAGPEAIGIDGFFSGAPGAFEIDIQGAEIDADTNYSVVTGGIINAVDANNQFHLDLPNVIARFVRPNLKTRTNAVNLTLTIRRG